MIIIRHESDFRNWFKKNYKKLGFSKIVQSNSRSFPDFIMLEDGKKVRVELETKSSNFIMHKHPVDRVDKVICIEDDFKLDVPTIKIKNLKLIKSAKINSPYSFKSQILKLLKKNKVMTTSEVASIMKIGHSTSNRALLELIINGKIIRIKKLGVNLWMLK